MENTVENLILLAKQRHIDELKRLTFSTEFVETIGMIIHQLQVERGASTLHLASEGKRFRKELADIVRQNQTLDDTFKRALDQHLSHNQFNDAKQLTIISWVLLGFDEIKTLRQQVASLKIPFGNCIKSYSRMLNSLISLLFEITDSTVDTALSKHLVAMYNWVQAKEYAGQERAIGSYIHGTGIAHVESQQRLQNLIDLQERHIETFCQFALPEEVQTWQCIKTSDNTTKLEHFRRSLLSAAENEAIDSANASAWFDICSVRITEFWKLECQIVKSIHQALDTLTNAAEVELQNTKKYIQNLPKDKATSSEKAGSFFDLTIPVEQAFGFLAHESLNPYPIESIVSLLQQQSQQIASMETELSKTKKALNERKHIERAKGVLMQNLNLSEEEAYKYLRSTAMDQNRKIIDVAESILELSHQHR